MGNSIIDLPQFFASTLKRNLFLSRQDQVYLWSGDIPDRCEQGGGEDQGEGVVQLGWSVWSTDEDHKDSIEGDDNSKQEENQICW